MLEAPLIFRKENVMAKQVFVDFELPEAMLADTNKIIKERFPAWLVNRKDNQVASVRILWAGWLFLKYSEGLASKYDGRFPYVAYTLYTAVDRPYAFQTVMLESEYIDAMERMSRLYPDVFEDKTKDKNYFLAILGYACLRELYDNNIELHYDTEKANDLADSENAQLDYAWLEDGTNKPFSIKIKQLSKAKHDAGDEFHYRVQYSIPENGKDISNVVFYDDLEKVLDLEDVKITDDKGNEVTKEGNLKLDKDKESFTWQPSKEYLTQMPKHIYTADITVKLKTDADLSGYLNKATKNYEIPNVAHMKYNNKDIPSNPVKVETPPPAENKAVKSVQGLSGSYHEDKDNVEIGKDYTYKIEYTAGEGQHLTDVEFTDDLEDVLDLEKVVVKNSDGKDITRYT